MMSTAPSRSFTVLSLLSLLTAGLSAQHARTLSGQQREGFGAGTPVHLVYDYETGELTRSTATLAPSLGGPSGSIGAAAACFANDDASFPWAKFPATDELVDWGVKSCAASTFIESFTMAYGSTALDTSLGGPGAAFTVRFYEGTTGNGVLGQELARFDFSGLPASTTGGASFPYVLTVRIPRQSFCMPDGPIGWSYQNADGQSGPALIFAPNPALGTQDAFDWYTGPAANGNLTGTVKFQNSTDASFFMILEENAGTQRAARVPIFFLVSDELVTNDLPVLGSPIRMDVLGSAPLTAIGVSLRSLPPTTTPFGELLIDLAALAAPLSVRSGGSHDFTIPKDLTLVGQIFYTQGAQIDAAGITLTNRIDFLPGF